MPKKHRRKNQNTAKSLLALGVVILAGAIVLLKLQAPATAQTPPAAGQLPEVQLASALAAGKPVLGFFHSNNCASCIEMIGIVNQVYPAFSKEIILVDVNVYDPLNENLLRQEQIRVIPTMIFFNQQGEKETIMGVMQPEQLRAQLNVIVGD